MTTEAWLNQISNTLDNIRGYVQLYNQQSAAELELIRMRLDTLSLYFNVMCIIIIAYIIHHIFDAVWKR